MRLEMITFHPHWSRQRRPLTPTATPERLRALPKAEVHIHLEGCLTRRCSKTGALAGVAMLRPREWLLQFERSPGFPHFLDWPAVCRHARAFRRTRLRDEQAPSSRAARLRRPDLQPDPLDSLARPPAREMVDAIDAGLAAAEHDGPTPVGLCSELRAHSRRRLAELVDDLGGVAPSARRGVSIDWQRGRRRAYRAALCRRLSACRRGRAEAHRAMPGNRAAGGRRDVVWLLGADRIDHGVRAIEDPELVGLLAERGIALGICPTSNLTLGVCSSIAEHPIDCLRRAGCACRSTPMILRCSARPSKASTRSASASGWSDDDLCTGGDLRSTRASPRRGQKRLRSALARW